RVAAQELVTASTPDQMQDALLSSDAFLDGNQFNLWLSDEKTAPPVTARHIKKEKGKVTAEAAPAPPTAADPPVSEDLSAPSRGSARLITPHDLDLLKTEHQDTIAAFTHELNDQAHFVSYAPPAFVAFHEGSYLQLSMMTGLEKPASSSNYYLAAQAFDTHVAHLIRPVLSYFPQDPDFDGIVFSTIVKVPGSESSEAVEFFLPFRAMRCFSRFDCTGQQLLNAGFVLINGERAGLNLQTAEAVSK
ncbi:MAG TPA: hypothetical protein VGR50_06715, partial [Terriglobales bacterium]|nr:hypothetical protein [Terriglobales bacterium]